MAITARPPPCLAMCLPKPLFVMANLLAPAGGMNARERASSSAEIRDSYLNWYHDID